MALLPKKKSSPPCAILLFETHWTDRKQRLLDNSPKKIHFTPNTTESARPSQLKSVLIASLYTIMKAMVAGVKI
jgi:hypothetical protein